MQIGHFINMIFITQELHLSKYKGEQNLLQQQTCKTVVGTYKEANTMVQYKG